MSSKSDTIELRRNDVRLLVMYLENPDMIPKSYIEFPNLIAGLKKKLNE